MNETRIDFENNNCFVCGPTNPIGLRIKFRIDGDVCRGEFKPGKIMWATTISLMEGLSLVYWTM